MVLLHHLHRCLPAVPNGLLEEEPNNTTSKRRDEFFVWKASKRGGRGCGGARRTTDDKKQHAAPHVAFRRTHGRTPHARRTTTRRPMPPCRSLCPRPLGACPLGVCPLSVRVRGTPASEARPRPSRVRVRGTSASEARPRPRRVRVRGASASARDLARPRPSRVRVRWRPRPSRVRVRWRPLPWMSASTGMSIRTSAGRPRPWPSLPPKHKCLCPRLVSEAHVVDAWLELRLRRATVLTQVVTRSLNWYNKRGDSKW